MQQPRKEHLLKKKGGKNNNNRYLLPLFMNCCRMCLSWLALFILISILLLSQSFILTTVKIHRKLFSTQRLFTQLLLIRDLDAQWRCAAHWIGLEFTMYKQTFHDSEPWQALSSGRLVVTGLKQACALRLWSPCMGVLPRFWWMNGHDAIGLHSDSDV